MTFANPMRTIVNCIKEKNKIYTRSLPLTFRGPTLSGLYGPVLYGSSFKISLAARSWKELREKMLRIAPIWRYDHLGVLAAWLVAGI